MYMSDLYIYYRTVRFDSKIVNNRIEQFGTAFEQVKIVSTINDTEIELRIDFGCFG